MSDPRYRAGILAGCKNSLAPELRGWLGQTVAWWPWPARVPGVGPTAGTGPFARCAQAGCQRWTWARYGKPFDYAAPRRAPRWPHEEVPPTAEQAGCVPLCLTCARALAAQQAA